MKICVPVARDSERNDGSSGQPIRRLDGHVGIIDNSKPRFDVVARAAIAELAAAGMPHKDSLYVRKATATRAAEPAEIDRLAEGAVAVIVGSGD